MGGADLLRRAMGKKSPEEMAQAPRIVRTGRQERATTRTWRSSLLTRWKKFAGYGFNKSHSAAYALISYQTAWLKALSPPTEFLAATMSSDGRHGQADFLPRRPGQRR